MELRVRPSVYEPRGSLQFTVEQARPGGRGSSLRSVPCDSRQNSTPRAYSPMN